MLKKLVKLSLSGLILLLPLGAIQAQQPGPSPVAVAANDLVQEILSRSGSPATMTVSFQNVSQMKPDLQEAAQSSIFAGLRNAGVRVVQPGMALAELTVVFSEDRQSDVWIAIIRQGTNRRLVMKKVPRIEPSTAPRSPALILHANSVWQQDQPVLDFYFDNHNLVVLEATEVAFYTEDSGQWRQHYTLAINHAQVWPRDLRGRLHVNNGQLTVSLPGTLCSGTVSPPSLDCHTGDDPWQLEHGQLVAFYSSRRNFFNGILAGPNAGASVIPFFSAATWPNGDQQQWLFAGTDGHARLYQRDLSAPAQVFNGWGSNLAAIHSGCGSGWQVVASGSNDSIHPDTLQAFEIAGREPQAVSATVDMAGPISAIWTSGKTSEAVNAVMHSPATGKYEAIVLTVSCN